MTAPAFALRHVAKRYGRATVLEDVSLEAAPGACLALLGHNGAGKTTLMKIVLGLTRASTGRVEVLGAAPGSVEGKRAIGYLPENVAFAPAMSGRETLAFYARLKGEPAGAVPDLLERVGLGEAADRRVATYSKGMRQRLGLAQALLGRPRLLLLDEPTTGLDPMLRQAFFEIIGALTADGAAVVLSSHVLTELEARTDRVAIMRDGRLVAVDSLTGLRDRAGLPVRIRVRSAEAAEVARSLDGRQINGQAVELVCSAPEKIQLLRRLTSLPVSIDDVELAPPTLDEVYAHFGRSERGR